MCGWFRQVAAGSGESGRGHGTGPASPVVMAYAEGRQRGGGSVVRGIPGAGQLWSGTLPFL